MKYYSVVDTLDMSSKGLYNIPDEAYNEDLCWLILSNNKIRVIPEEIGILKKLTRLALNDNRIEKISSAIAGLQMLNWIDLTRNRLRELPMCLHTLPITGLGLSENEFTEIPVCVLRMTSLRKFGFFSNRIRTVSPSIANLVNLVKIDLSNNFINKLPDEFCKLKNLTWLNLSNNCLVELPRKIGDLVNLEELGLGSNKLEYLPDISKLTKLRILPVFKNKLKKVNVTNLKNIEKLDFSDNELTEFPYEVIYLKSLRYLNLKNNKIQSIDLELYGVVSNISLLDLSDNKMKYIPAKFFRIFSNLTTIRVSNNPYAFTSFRNSEFKVIPMNMMAVNKLIAMGNYNGPKYLCDICNNFFVNEPNYSYSVSGVNEERVFLLRKTKCKITCKRD